MLSFYFFQAEDGIQDWSVTGVQTCALPICALAVREAAAGELLPGGRGERRSRQVDRQPARRRARAGDRVFHGDSPRRSEERRVGKKGRSGWTSESRKEQTLHQHWQNTE